MAVCQDRQALKPPLQPSPSPQCTRTAHCLCLKQRLAECMSGYCAIRRRYCEVLRLLRLGAAAQSRGSGDAMLSHRSAQGLFCSMAIQRRCTTLWLNPTACAVHARACAAVCGWRIGGWPAQPETRTCTSSNRCGCAIASCTFACVHRPPMLWWQNQWHSSMAAKAVWPQQRAPKQQRMLPQ